MNICLIGYKNCGKTSVGEILARKTNRNFIDTDCLLSQRHLHNTGKRLSVAEIFKTAGEDYFREQERLVITSLLAVENSIIATGGGTILQTENCTLLKKIGKIIYLSAPPALLLSRLTSEQMPKSAYFYDPAREICYLAIADFSVLVEGKSIATIVNEIIEYMEQL